MFPERVRQRLTAVQVPLVAVGGSTAAVAAQRGDRGVEGCLDGPGGQPSEIVPGGGAFDAPVVDATGVVPADRVTLNDDFEAFLKAKKAFDE
jgi:hypothetical protein